MAGDGGGRGWLRLLSGKITRFRAIKPHSRARVVAGDGLLRGRVMAVQQHRARAKGESIERVDWGSWGVGTGLKLERMQWRMMRAVKLDERLVYLRGL